MLIVLLERPTGQSAAPILRDATARSALHAVQLAFTKNPSLQHAIVSVRLVPDSGHVQPLFDGEIDRTAAQGVSSTGSAEQALAAFKGVEWASTSSPTTPPSSQGHDTDHLEPSTPGPHSSPTPGSSTPPPNDPNPSGG